MSSESAQRAWEPEAGCPWPANIPYPSPDGRPLPGLQIPFRRTLLNSSGPALTAARPPAQHLRSTLGMWPQGDLFPAHAWAPAVQSPHSPPSLVCLCPPCPQPGTAGRTVGPGKLGRSHVGGETRLSAFPEGCGPCVAHLVRRPEGGGDRSRPASQGVPSCQGLPSWHPGLCSSLPYPVPFLPDPRHPGLPHGGHRAVAVH